MAIKLILNMIMKNEASAGVLIRGLENLKHIFQYYAIVDTGSTDNSIEIVKKWMKDNGKEGKIDSKVQNTLGFNFGLARTQALNLAYDVMDMLDKEGKDTFYAMFHDSDNSAWSNKQEKIPETPEEREKGILFPFTRDTRKSLKGDKIEVDMKNGSMTYAYGWMVNLGTTKKKKPWQWICGCHEYVDDCGTGNARNQQKIEGGYIHSGRDGARGKTVSNRITKYVRDFITLEEELSDPNTNAPKARDMFYLANSYKDAGWWERAAECYEKRTKMINYMEEIYVSYKQLGEMYARMGKDIEVIMKPLFQAMTRFPHRLEAPNFFVNIMMNNGRHEEAWMVGKNFLYTPYPKNDKLFIEHRLYEYEFDYSMLKACYWACMHTCNVDLEHGKLEGYDPNKNGQYGHSMIPKYKEILKSLMDREYPRDKTYLIPHVQNTPKFFWTEEEKNALYALLRKISGSHLTPQSKQEVKTNENVKKLEEPIKEKEVPRGPIGMMI